MRLLLRNSNTARKGGFGRRWLVHRFLIGVALVCSAAPANAIDPDRAISQYIRDQWGSDKGFPGGSVSAIAQSADGYLWIGTDKGLIRFDGLNFQLFPLAVPSSLPIGPIQGLMADAEGNLWIVLQSTQILRYHDGNLTSGAGRQSSESLPSVGAETVPSCSPLLPLALLHSVPENTKFSCLHLNYRLRKRPQQRKRTLAIPASAGP